MMVLNLSTIVEGYGGAERRSVHYHRELPLHPRATIMATRSAIRALRAAIAVLSAVCGLTRPAVTADGQPSADDPADRIVSATQDWGELGLNTAVKPLDGRQALKLRIGDREFARGLGQHANGEIVVDLDGRYKTFEATIGVQWQGGSTPASVVFQVFVDDQKRFDGGVLREKDPPRNLSIPLEGADQLRLVATDGGDGIHSDAANWCDARLVRDPNPRPRPDRIEGDVAPFGRACTWDPKRLEGTRAGRTEEFPAGDLRLGKELAAGKDGTWDVPRWAGGVGCIGLEWSELRSLRGLAIQWADGAQVPPPETVTLQSWVGESPWQGKWVALSADLEKSSEGPKNQWTWRVGAKSQAQGTHKVRWLFAASQAPPPIRRLIAIPRSPWLKAAIRIEAVRPGPVSAGRIEIHNGAILAPDGTPSPRAAAFEVGRPQTLQVAYSKPARHQADRTVLRFHLGEGAFSVAIEDVFAQEAVYLPHVGLFITRDPPPVTAAEHLKKTAGKKTVLERVRGMPDQTFEWAIAKVHNPVQDLGPTMLSLACDNRKFVVEREGSILFDLYQRPDAPGPGGEFGCKLAVQFGTGKPQDLKRHLDGGWLPLPVTTVKQGGIVYRQRTGVMPLADKVPVPPAPGSWMPQQAACVVEFAIDNPRPEPAAAALTLALIADVKKNQRAEVRPTADGMIATAGGRLVAFIDTSVAGPIKAVSDSGSILLRGTLPPRKPAKVLVFLPAWHIGGEDARLHFRGKADWARAVEAYWKTVMEPAMQIDLPDPFLADVIRASQVHCLMAARNEDQGRHIAAWIASDRYGPLESEAQAVIRGMDLMGHDQFARRSLDFFVERYHSSGYLTTGYTLIGTGWHLWTLTDHFDRTQDREWLARVAPKVAGCCEWIVRQRQKTRAIDASGQERPESGLMPPGVVADWNRYAYRFFADALYYAGLSNCSRVLAEVRHPRASAFANEAQQYRRDILRAYRWNQARSPVVRLGSGAWVPPAPSMLYCFGDVGRFFPGEDWNRTWAGDIEIGAHHLAANGILDPTSDEVAWITDYMEDVQFLLTGMGDYPGEQSRQDPFNLGGFAKVQPYYGRLIEIYAARDDVKPYVRAYFNAIPSLVSRENLSFWEHFHNGGAWNKTHETGWFLAQTRMMLVMERGQELWLAPFVTDQWLKDGMKLSVRNAPTRFGKVSYAITSAARRGSIEATIDPPTRNAPREIVLRLRHPEGKPMRSVSVGGKPHQDFDPARQCIRLEPGREQLVVRVEY